jgi:para-nitrobenzyl esterase
MAHLGTVHVYQFSRVGPRSRRLWQGAAHTSDLPYVFDHVTLPSDDFESEDAAISEAMVGAWVGFAKTGDPNAAALPKWPAYQAPEYLYLNYSNTVSVDSGFRESQIEFCAAMLRRAGGGEKNQ